MEEHRRKGRSAIAPFGIEKNTIASILATRMIEVRTTRGLHVPEAGLWLDARRSRDRAFVSHAHADHYAKHEWTICSPATAHLLRRRFRAEQDRMTVVPWGKVIESSGFQMRMLPAGHITGSAMLHLTRSSDGATLLYTGDTKGHGGRTCEPAEWAQADTLILETTFGLPRYVFPSIQEVEARVITFVKEALAEGSTPVLLGYSLGKAQEALALLAAHGIPACAHPAIRAMTTACRQLGVSLVQPAAVDAAGVPSGHVLVAPPPCVRSPWLRTMPNLRTAMLSGWGIQPGSAARYGVDVVIPWSDHADHPGLWDCIRRVQPKRVFTVHGYAREFAAELRRHGIEAWSAMGSDQLELTALWPQP